VSVSTEHESGDAAAAIDPNSVSPDQQQEAGPEPTPLEILASLSSRLRYRDEIRLYVRFVLLNQKALLIAQLSAGVWTVVAWIIGFAVSKREAPKEFYTASSSAITTLLLALAVTAA
jgi:hypothetical protein